MKGAVTSHNTTGVSAVMLPGGGARGAYQVGVLKAIASFSKADARPFSVICGTSAGSINAAVLASHAHEYAVGVERLEHFWAGLACSDIYRTDPLTVLGTALRWFLGLASGGWLKVSPKALLDNAPLRRFLGQTLQLDGIDTAIECGALRGVAVTASGYTSAQAVSFFQGASGLSSWSRHRRQGRRTDIGVEHLLASAALPLLFPAERIGNEFFGDGGMRMTAPLSPAVHLGADRILVIGTRDENPDPEPEMPTESPSLGELGGYLLDTIFMDRLNADLARLKRINRSLSLMDAAGRTSSGLRPVDTLVVRPSRDLRDITAEHAGDIPWAVRLLLRSLGGWGRDWRMPSYLLFESGYCRALIELGYQDGLAQERRLRDFLEP